MSVEIQPKEVLPGDVFLLKVYTDKNPSANPGSPQAEFAGREMAFFQTADNHFIALIPVDIETPPKKYPITIASGEEARTVYLRVKRYKFPTQRITLPEEKVILSPEDLKRAGKEAGLMKSVLSQITMREWDGRFAVPTGTAISEVFGVKRVMNGKKTSVHCGIDYKGQTGTPVRAVNSGKVVLREELFFGGNTVVIDHGTGLFSVYMHLSGFHVAKDEKVSKGQMIGLVGMSGRATGPHLHFGFNLQGVKVNPLSIFKLEL
ncbi:MAG: M23 family metallopeptidase [Nitrospirae bacterium]|nr:M23 family metallopeptidase [Nitrospirota bacterium]